MNLLQGYKIYKDVQGKEYDSVSEETKEHLILFRKEFGDFTDSIFMKKELHPVSNGKGMWQNSGHFTKYMWNRYKLSDDLKSHLVIYFNASTVESNGLFISIGLIDDKLNQFEIKNHEKIYDFLEKECKKIECTGFKRIDAGWGERVFKIINEDQYENLDYDCLLDKLKRAYEYTLNKIYSKRNDANTPTNIPLNQILYGPPGTGKTYHTINKSLQIIDGEVPSDREEAKKRFETLKEAGQIEFITFHQSYGYEEFVEGIKADVKSNDIRYSIEDGIFKHLADVARKQYDDSKKSQSELATEISLKDHVGEFLNKALEEELVFTKTKGGKFRVKDLSEKSIVLYSEDSNYNENSITLDFDEFYKIVNTDADFKTSRQMAQEVFNISNQRQKDTYYLSLYKEYRKLPFHEINSTHASVEEKNYILIIDEINRGNISKIFGELITLIEESKRIGNAEAMEITLPYSGETFGVPKNLYIIGTMNTADRSIALMDTALRRRFEFEEKMPEPERLGEVEGIDLRKFLARINQRIEYLYDRDHTIGHAYFMGVDNQAKLDNVMQNKVIPLLQEYFYDDWEKILLILNDGFIVKQMQDARKLFDDMDDEYMDEDKYSYSIASEFSEESYRKIYGTIGQVQEGE